MLFIDNLPERYHLAARQLVKFGITGLVGAVVDFGTLFLLRDVAGWRTLYTVFGTKLIGANMVSVFLAIVSNFTLNKYWTFRDRESNIASQGAGYFILNLFTWVLNQILTSFFTFHVAWIAVLFGDAAVYAAKMLAIAFILIINFFGSKFIIFRKRPVPGTM